MPGTDNYEIEAAGEVGGPVIRSLQRYLAGPYTPVVQLDIGGSSGNAESLVTTTNPLPVIIISGGSGGGGSDPDADSALGVVSDAQATNATSSWSIIALLKGIFSNQTRAFTPTSNSGEFTVGAAGTDQVALVANAARKYLSITNNHASATLYVNPLGAAYVSGAYMGFPVTPGATYFWDTAVPNSDIHCASSVASLSYFIMEG